MSKISSNDYYNVGAQQIFIIKSLIFLFMLFSQMFIFIEYSNPYALLILTLCFLFFLGIYKNIINTLIIVTLLLQMQNLYLLQDLNLNIIFFIFTPILILIYYTLNISKYDLVSYDNIQEFWKKSINSLNKKLQYKNNSYSKKINFYYYQLFILILFIIQYFIIVREMGSEDLFVSFIFFFLIFMLILTIIYKNINCIAVLLLVIASMFFFILTQSYFYLINIVLLSLINFESIFKKIKYSKSKIIYDGECYFCCKSLLLFKQLDMQNTFEFIPYQNYKEKTKKLDFVKYMYLITNNRNFEGYFAFREMMKRIKVFYIIYIIMLFPPIIFIGTKIYNYVAKNRKELFVCRIK